MTSQTGALLHQAEGRSALLIENNYFSVENCILSSHEFRQISQLRIAGSEIVLVARNQTYTSVFNKSDGPVTVPLDFEQPLAITERHFRHQREHRRDVLCYCPFL